MSCREPDSVTFEGTEPDVVSCLRVTACALDHLSTMLAEAARLAAEEPVPEDQKVYQRTAGCAAGQLSIISEHLYEAAGDPPEADRHLWPPGLWHSGGCGNGGAPS